jgi:hypothetical protein
VSGFSTADSRFVSGRASDPDGWHKRYEGLYLFGPPERNTLCPVSNDRVLMPRKYVVGVTNWSGEGVGAKSLWVLNDHLITNP